MEKAGIYSELGSDPMFAELLELFVSELPNRVAGLEEAVSGEDRETLGTLAHLIRGAAGSYGFQALCPLAGELEEKSPTADFSELSALLSQFGDLCGQVRVGQPENAC